MFHCANHGIKFLIHKVCAVSHIPISTFCAISVFYHSHVAKRKLSVTEVGDLLKVLWL